MTRFVFAGLIGAATGVVLAAVTVVSVYSPEVTPWGVMLYGAPYGAGIGAAEPFDGLSAFLLRAKKNMCG